jgi:phospholipid/cholesterol/gamma-HCH transport system permease protein
MRRVSAGAVAKPFGAVGGFYAMALDTLVAITRPPFAWREFLLQTWFVARVSILPTVMLAIPFAVLMVFTSTPCSWSSGAPITPAPAPPLEL